MRAKKRLALFSTRNAEVEKQLDFDADAAALSSSNRELAHADGKTSAPRRAALASRRRRDPLLRAAPDGAT